MAVNAFDPRVAASVFAERWYRITTDESTVIRRRIPILAEVDRPVHLRLLRRADDAALMFYARLTARRRKLERGVR